VRGPRLRKRLARIGLAVAIGLALSWFIAPMLLRRLLRTRLQAMIADQLNAELRIGGLSYSFPYAVDVTDAELVAQDPQGNPLELVRVPHLALSLARSPLRSGPLVIQSVQIDDPAIHLIQATGGLVGQRSQAKAQNPTPESGAAEQWKLSQMFQLRRLALHGGTVIYEDRTLARTRPLVWKNLNVDLDTAPESGSQYSFHFIADNAPLATLDAMGQADIDEFLLRLSSCRLSLNVDPGREHSALPPEYQQALERLGVRGALVINTVATLPLRDLQHSRYDTTLELRDASASLPSLSRPIEKLSARFNVVDGGGHPALHLNFVDAMSDGVAVRLTGGSVAIDPDSLIWTLSALKGQIEATPPGGPFNGAVEFTLSGSAPLLAGDVRQYAGELHLLPHHLTTTLPAFPQGLDQFADTTIALKGGILAARQLRAGYGSDVWYIKQADVDLTRLPGQLVIRNAQGCLTFGTRRAKYPSGMEEFLAPLNPAGPWFFDASDVRVSLSDPNDVDYHGLVHTTRGVFALNDGRIPIYNISTAIGVAPELIEVRQFDAGAMNGELHLAGWMKPRQQARYVFNGIVRRADLNLLTQALQKPGQRATPLFGKLDLRIGGDGFFPTDSRSAADVLVARGMAQIRDGDFWRIPVMKQIAESSGVREALTVGQAATVFDISRATVHLHRATASAPLLGVQGSGDISFKGDLNLELIATPLGNWGEKLDHGFFSGVANAVQQGINVATRTALYDIHVRGTPNNPKVNTVPAPFITKEATDLVNFLTGKSQHHDMLDYTQQQAN
jgi:hypothetical protein